MTSGVPDWPPAAPNVSTILEIASPRDLRWFLRSYRLPIVATTLVATLLGALWIYFFPPRYVSAATVRFLPPQVAGRFVNPNFSMEVGQRLFALSQLLGSRLTATKLIEACGLYPERRRFETVEDLTARFGRDLQIVPIGSGSQSEKTEVPTLKITFAYQDAEVARKVVQKLVEQVYEENRKYRGDQSLGATEFLQSQLTAAEERVLETEQQLGAIQDSIGLTVSQTQLGQSTARNYVIDTRLRDLRRDHRLLEERRAALKAEWEQLEVVHRRIEARPAEFYIPEFEGMPNYWHMRDLLVAARGQYDRLRERYQDHMPEVVTAKNHVAEMEANIERFHRERGSRLRYRDLEANAAKIAQAKLGLQALEKESAEHTREEGELRAEAQRLREQAANPGGLEVDLLIAKREYEAAKDRHNELLKKFEQSQAASEMERRGQGEVVELLDPASKATSPEAPNAYVRLALASGLGLVSSTLCCFLWAMRRPVILSDAHIERWASLPVLASFSSTGRKALTSASLLVVMLLSGCGAWRQSPAALVAQAETAERENRLPAAVLLFRKALQGNPRQAEAHLGLSRIALRMGELETAREALARAVEVSPGQLNLTRQLADLTYQLYFRDPGRPMTLLREVEALGERLRKQWPAAPDGYRILAQVLMERHRTDEAVELLSAAAKTLTNNEVLRAQWSAALLRLGRSEESEELLEELIAERPQYAEAYDLLYLQRMRAGQAEGARAVLAAKWAKTQSVDAALQLAAHDDAHEGAARAAEVLRGAMAVVEGSPLGHARIGDFWLQRGDLAAARAAYEAGLAQAGRWRADYAGRLAEWHLAKNETAAAQKWIDEELRRQPGQPLLEAYAAALRLGEVPAARRSELRQRLESILQQLPDSPFVRYHLGRAYLLENQPQVALESFEQAVKLDPNYAPGWLALAELELVRGNAAGAEARAGALLARYPSHARALLVNARAQTARGRFAEATSALRQLLRHNPENLDAQYLLGINQARQERYAEAVASFQHGRKTEPQNPRWLLALAAIESRQGRPQRALELLEGSKAADPQLMARYAYLQLELRDGVGAKKSFAQLAEKTPESAEVALGLAAAEALAGDVAGALARYERLREKYPTEVRAHLQAAALLDEKGNTAEALALYESALKLDPNQPLVLNNLAWLLLKAKTNPQRALELAQRAKQFTRQSAEVDGTLAQAYAATGLHRNALAIYEEMLSYVPAPERPRIEQLLAATRQRMTPEKRS